MRKVDEIIALLGGPEQAARIAGVGVEAVRKWRQADAIPPKHWTAIIGATGVDIASLQRAPAAGGLATIDPAFDPTSQPPPGATACLVFADGSSFWGIGFGAHTDATRRGLGEICFSTGMTGYQETISDPSFAGQVITFTFPHIGNVGTNNADLESQTVAARGVVTNRLPTRPSNWRSTDDLGQFLVKHGVPGIAGVDTRALTLRIRDGGFVTAILSHPADGRFDLRALLAEARAWPGLDGMDLARSVSCTQSYEWDEAVWSWAGETRPVADDAPHVVAVDYGAKRNILRNLVSSGFRVTVVPAAATADDILRHEPDGVFLSNGPGDPAATAEYAVPAIQGVMAANVPVFGICLGHQLLALALGARTYKLRQGHRGANQPVRERATGRVEITSQNHGFAVDDQSLPPDVEITHVSLFDGSNEGIACPARRAFSVQYHPEAAPGPSDSTHLFQRFRSAIDAARRR